MKWQQVKKRWWWLRANKLAQFKADRYALAYESLRRRSSYVQEPFFQRHQDKIWLDLGKNGQRLFITTYWRHLASLELGPAVQFVGPCVYFDLTYPNYRILSDLKEVMKRPPALMVCHDGQGIVPRGKKGKRKDRDYKRRTPQTNHWTPVPRDDSSLIKYTFPKRAQGWGKRKVTADETLANVRTFLEDPPTGFINHRHRVGGIKQKRKKGPTPRTIVLGLMACDCKLIAPKKTLKCLADYIQAWRLDFDFPKDTDLINRSLQDARARILRLF